MNYKDLSRLMDLQYQVKQSELRRVAGLEATLRADIAKLDQQRRAVDEAGNEAMKSVGADMLWRGWSGRTKSELNMRLAQVLARKESLLYRARKDYGKVLVSQKLSADDRRNKALAKDRSSLEKTLEISVLQNVLNSNEKR